MFQSAMKTRIHPLLPPVLLFLITFTLFAPSIGYRLVSLDDSIFIYNNPIVFNGFSWESLGHAFTSLHGDKAMYTPLLWISYLLDNLFFGASPYSPWGYHLTNVLLHAANAVLLYFILLSAVRRPWLACFAAAFWALHPLRVESVAWVTERKDTLSTFFALASILLYLKAFSPRGGTSSPHDGGPGAQPPPSTRHSSLVTRHCNKGYQCLALAAFVAGLLSKPMLVTLPFLFLLLDFWPLKRFTLREAPRALPRLALGKWPFFLLVVLFSLLTYRLQTSAIADLPLSFRLLRLPVNYLFYVSRTLWPVNLCPLSAGFPATSLWVLSACMFFLFLAIASGLSFKRAPGILVGLLAFAGLLAPVSGIVFIGGVPVADRYSYLPSLGLAIALLSSLDLLWERGRSTRDGLPSAIRPLSFVILPCVVLGAETAVSLHLLPSWENAETFAARAEKIAPDHKLSLMYRFTTAFYFQGDLPAAEATAETCRRLQPDAPFTALAKILVLSQTDSSAAATALFEAHPVHNPTHDPSLDNLAVALAVLYADTGDFGKGAACLEEALSNPYCLPKLAEAIAAIAFWFHAIQGQDDLAAGFARSIPSMDASDIHAPGNFLLPYTAMWNLGLRRQTLPKFLELAADPKASPGLLNNIAWLLATAPNSPAPPADVLAIARRALSLHPDHPVIRDTLAVALAFDGRFDEAVTLESEVADFLRASSAPGAPAMLANIEKRIDLFRSRVPFTENAELKLLFAP